MRKFKPEIVNKNIQKKSIDLMYPNDKVDKTVVHHKTKRNWEPWKRTKALPISLNGMKGYHITLVSDSRDFIEILIWTKRPTVSMRRICSQQRSIKDIRKLHGLMIDDIEL